MSNDKSDNPTASTESEPTEAELVAAVYELAERLVSEGGTPQEVMAGLQGEGVTEEVAEIVTTNVFIALKEAEDAAMDAAESEVSTGMFWCIGGAIVTGLTYAMAANGGTYVIAWGAILFGGIQMLQGIAERSRIHNNRRT